MTGRSPNRLTAARAALRRRIPDAADRVETLLLDTSNLGSVRAAAATVGGRGRLDGLLLNAGIVHPPKERETTGDGQRGRLRDERARPLRARRRAADDAGRGIRSHGVARQHVDLDVAVRPGRPAAASTGTRGWRAYVQSKVATAALGFEADRRLRAAGVPVTSVVAHPGYSTSGRTPGDRRRERADQAHAVRRQPAVRDHAVQGARRVDARARARRPRRSRAASSGVRGSWPAASRTGADGVEDHPRSRDRRAAVGRVRGRHRRALAVRPRRRARRPDGAAPAQALSQTASAAAAGSGDSTVGAGRCREGGGIRHRHRRRRPRRRPPPRRAAARGRGRSRAARGRCGPARRRRAARRARGGRRPRHPESHRRAGRTAGGPSRSSMPSSSRSLIACSSTSASSCTSSHA